MIYRILKKIRNFRKICLLLLLAEVHIASFSQVTADERLINENAIEGLNTFELGNARKIGTAILRIISEKQVAVFKITII